MSNNNANVPIKTELLEAIKQLCANNREISLVSLCTTDGFNIKSFASKELSAQADKIAAISSTLCALSNSSSEQIMGQEFNITTVENPGGNMLFVRTGYLDFSCVLAVAAKSRMSLATARYTTMRLAERIADIK